MLKRFCLKCSELVTANEKYCEAHKQQQHQRYDQYRESAAKRGYDAKWRKARAAFLRENPLCMECLKRGQLTPATVVDHIVPHKGDMKLFWDRKNWQPLCKRDHDAKTAREDGGFGR